jgi:hypothetical protein
VNKDEKQEFEGRGSTPVFWQDKYSASRYSTASDRGYNKQIPALKGREGTQSQQSRSVIVSACIDQDTFAYIRDRRARSKNSDGSRMSQSKVVAQMLKERAQDEIFAHSQSILMPLIQDTMRQEFRIFANRFLRIVARMAYGIGWMLFLMRRFVSMLLAGSPAAFEQIDRDSERDALTFLTTRSPKIDQAAHTLQLEMEGVKERHV